MSDGLHIARPLVPDVMLCMKHFDEVMRMLVAGDQGFADAYLAKVKEDDGDVVYRAVMRMLTAAHEE